MRKRILAIFLCLILTLSLAAAVAAKVLETIRYMRTHRPPWWLYWTPTIMWALTAAIAAAILLK